MVKKCSGILLVSLLVVLAFVLGVGAANQPDVISVGSVSGVQENQISIPLFITPNSEVSAFNLEVLYDPNILQPGVQSGEGLKYLDSQNTLTSTYEMLLANHVAPGRLSVGGAALTPTLDGGLFLNVLFTIKSDAQNYGESVVDLSLLQDEGNDLARFEVVPGFVGLLDLPPVVDSVPAQEVYVNNLLVFNVGAADPNHGSLVFSLGPDSPLGSSIDSATGMFSWAPSIDGVSNFDVLVSDGVNEVVVPIIVNALNIAPVADVIPPQTVYVDDMFTFTVSAGDVNHDKLVFSLGANSPQGSYINPDTGFFIWVPTQAGVFNFELAVSDGINSATVVPMTVTVLANPTVMSVEPMDGSVDVPRVSSLKITFSRDMTVSTLNANSIVLKNPQGVRVPGSVSYSDKVAVFTPLKPLGSDVVYTATVVKTVKDTTGRSLAADYSWSFTTELPNLEPPVVASTSPMNEESNIPVYWVVTAAFSGDMNPMTVNSNSFVLKDDKGMRVPGSVSYSKSVAVFRPLKILKPNIVYTATVTKAAKDVFGTGLASDYSWSFTTASVDALVLGVSSTSPANNDVDIPLKPVLTAVFNKPLNKLTLNSNSFVLKDSSNRGVPGVIVASGNTVTFKPIKPLNTNTVYTATIRSGVKDLLGNALGSDYSWSFTTELPDLTPPVVTASSPVRDSVDIPLASTLTVSFSEDLKSLTVNSNSFVLKDNRGMRVPGKVYYNNKIATFKPVKPLKNNAVYTATISKVVKDLAGNSLAADYSWSFRTAALF